jgi:hypothetical protein
VLVDTLRPLVDSMRRPGRRQRSRTRLSRIREPLPRSELVALETEDLNFTDDGLEELLRRSKTDQEGVGRKVGIPYGGRPRMCPVRAVQD